MRILTVKSASKFLEALLLWIEINNLLLWD